MAKQNNSDWMSEYQDKELERIEKDISSLYSNAAKEVNAELAKFTESYEKQLVAKQAELDAGDITKSEYQVWVQKQMLQTDRYKATVNHMTDILVKSDKAAMAVVNGKLPSVVAESYNFSQALGFEAARKAGLSVGTFQVYNAKSVQKIIKDNPKLLKEVDVPEDKKWNQTKINREITTGLLKGESIPKVSDRLRRVTDMDKNAATRNARTAMTAAENVGRSESAEELKEKGIPVEEVWSAAIDKRTRETHILLDGTVKDENGFFGADILLHPLRYPADPDGDPEEIYNCRCRLNIQLKGIDHSNDKELYEKFMKENDPDSYKRIREVDEPKEEAYQRNKERAEASLPARQERIRELRGQTQEQVQAQTKKNEVEFVPAKTIEAAEKYAHDNFVVESRWMGEGKVNYTGMSLDNANAINKELTNLFNQTNAPKFRNIEMMNLRKGIFKDSKDAPMAYGRMGDLYFNPRILKDQKSVDKYFAKGKEAFDYCVNNTDKFTGRQLEIVLRYKEAGRQTIADDCENKIKAMTDHEFGHHIDHSIIRKNSDYANVVKDGMDEYGTKLSGYSLHSSGEYVAESFCSYSNGIGTIDPALKDIFDKEVMK